MRFWKANAQMPSVKLAVEVAVEQYIAEVSNTAVAVTATAVLLTSHTSRQTFAACINKRCKQRILRTNFSLKLCAHVLLVTLPFYAYAISTWPKCQYRLVRLIIALCHVFTVIRYIIIYCAQNIYLTWF